MTLDKSAKLLLAREGYDPQFGARPLRRTIQSMVLDPLAMRVLEGHFVEGDNVVVDTDTREGLTFEKRETVKA